MGASQLNVKAQVVGDKIYISQPTFNEFLIYDPSKKKSEISSKQLTWKKGKDQLLRSEDLPPRDGWGVKTFENHTILFKISGVPGKAWIEYQDLCIKSKFLWNQS